MSHKLREITICGKHESRQTYSIVVPDLRLKGIWMEDAGFHVGVRVLIEFDEGKLIISRAEEQPPWVKDE